MRDDGDLDGMQDFLNAQHCSATTISGRGVRTYESHVLYIFLGTIWGTTLLFGNSAQDMYRTVPGLEFYWKNRVVNASWNSETELTICNFSSDKGTLEYLL
jgi:hypothetical protein